MGVESRPIEDTVNDCKTADTKESLDRNNETIQRLAKLPPLDYDQVRQAEAEKLGVRVTTLDEEVKKVRPKLESDAQNMGEIETGVEPYHEVVNGDEMALEIYSILAKNLVASEEQIIVIVLWIIGTYCFDVFIIFPKLLITSPEKRCGKSTLLRILYYFCNKALLASNITPAAMFRSIELWYPTMLIDEADTYLNDNPELGGIINSGHSKDTAFVIRVEGDGNNRQPKRFSTWAPMAIAMIKKPKDTIVDRSVVITLRRKLSSERIQKLKINGYELLKIYRQKMRRWVDDNIEKLKIIPIVPDCGNDRAVDNWEPLFAIAKALGGNWLINLEAAYRQINQSSNEETLSTMLLEDIKNIFFKEMIEKKSEKENERLDSATLVQSLINLEERPWREYRHGKSLTANNLAKMLRPFGIYSRQILIKGANKHGYMLSNFKDAFDRYLPPNEAL